ncbi:MAG: hypothetical protein RLZZ387_3757 [Chloroflexota bacterium]
MHHTVLSPCAPSASGSEVAPVRATTLPAVVIHDDALPAPLDVLDLADALRQRPAAAAAPRSPTPTPPPSPGSTSAPERIAALLTLVEAPPAPDDAGDVPF